MTPGILREHALTTLCLAFQDQQVERDLLVEGLRLDLYLRKCKVAVQVRSEGSSAEDLGLQALVARDLGCQFVLVRIDRQPFRLGKWVFAVRSLFEVGQSSITVTRPSRS